MYEAVTNSAEVIAGVLGIAVTVVAIIVELAATRYNHRITDLFIREPLNLIVLGFFVATTLMCVWVAALSGPDGMAWLHQATMGMITVALVLLLPYFVYVLSFISPDNVTRRISAKARREVARCSKTYSPQRRDSVARAVEELQDVLRSAIERGDRDIAIGCVDAMVELLRSYQKPAVTLPAAWYELDIGGDRDPDFVSLEPSALARINENRTWFEYKIFSQFLKAMRLCSPRAHDVAFQIFTRTRQLALEQQPGSRRFELCLWAFNSYLRLTIFNRDVRSSFFGLNQYRKVAEVLVERKAPAEVILIIHRLREYSRLALQHGQEFLLEACAYDLLQLLKKSLGVLDEVIDVMLDVLLELDREQSAESSEVMPTGVRRAQIQAAVALIAGGETMRARRVIEDLAGERQINTDKLIRQLEEEQAEDFWELSPLGTNFLYVAPEERVHLKSVREQLSAIRTDVSVHTPTAG